MGRLNKSEIPGYRYRSPGQTNANDIMPNLREDVVSSRRADTERIKRGLDTSGTRPQNLKQVQEAGGRGLTRTGGRAGYAAAALETGYALGREVDERTGVGKKMVENSSALKEVAKQLSKSERVKLSDNAKERLADIENDKSLREIDADKKASKYGKGDYAKGGMVVANCGASMKPQQGRK
jgi:hypothetical protein